MIIGPLVNKYDVTGCHRIFSLRYLRNQHNFFLQITTIITYFKNFGTKCKIFFLIQDVALIFHFL